MSKKVEQVNINDESSYKRRLFTNNLSLTYRNESVEINSVTGYQYLDDDMKMDVDEMVREVHERILLFQDRSEWRAAGDTTVCVWIA
jgi:hypothetical protein